MADRKVDLVRCFAVLLDKKTGQMVLAIGAEAFVLDAKAARQIGESLVLAADKMGDEAPSLGAYN